MSNLTGQSEALGKTRYSRIVLEQVTFTVTQAAVQILAGRWLAQEAFGAFSLISAVILLVMRAQYAILIEPTLVFFPSRKRDGRAGYLEDVSNLEYRLELGLLCVVLLVGSWGWLVQSEEVILASACMAYLLGQLALNARRRLAYLTQDEARVARGTLFRTLGALAVVVAWGRMETLGLEILLFCLGFAYFVPDRSWIATAFRRWNFAVVRQHFRYGRLAGAALCAWGLVDAAPYFVLAWTAGAEGVALYQVAIVLFAPIVQLAGTLAVATLPNTKAADSTGEGGGLSMRVPLLLCIIATVGVILVGPFALSVVFGERYAASAELLVALSPFPVFLLMAHLFANRLKARGRLVPLILVGIATLPAMIGGVLAGNRGLGLVGACLGVSVGYAVQATLVWWSARPQSIPRRV